MRSAPKQVYNKPLELLTVFDCRDVLAAERLRWERRAWGPYASVENLGYGRAALIVRPGGALGLAR